MLTRCPQCFAWFRVRAEQLSLANGLVTCGRCEQVFNALASLLEESAAAQSPVPPRIETVVPATEPAQLAVGETPATPALHFVAVVATTSVTPPRARAAIKVLSTQTSHRVATSSALSGAPLATDAQAIRQHDDAAAPRADLLPPPEAAELASDVADLQAPAASRDPGLISAPLETVDISDFDFAAVADTEQAFAPEADARLSHAAVIEDEEHRAPAVLLADLAALTAAPRPSRGPTLAWAVFGLVLASLAAVQVAFVARQPLLVQLPGAARLIDPLCARLPCLERRPAASSVRLLARDVREHPSYRDALLVNATIVNEATIPSAYPVIDLRLRDAAGNVLSARQFQPAEYLDQSIALAAGMPSDRPVYIVLELAGSASNAVSFEFTFL